MASSRSGSSSEQVINALATPDNSRAAARRGVDGDGSAADVVPPHLLHRGAVEPRRGEELVLGRCRPVVEHGLVQQLKHDGGHVPIGGTLREPRRQCRAGAAARDRDAGRVQSQFRGVLRDPVQHRRRIVECGGMRMFGRQSVVDGHHGAAPPAWRTRRTGGDRCRGCPARKPLSDSRSPRAPAGRTAIDRAPAPTPHRRCSISTPAGVDTSRDVSARRWFKESRTKPSTLGDRSVRAAAR